MSSSLDILKGGPKMTMPRSRYVQEGEVGVYHCFSRCVRRAFLYGYDARTHRDFSHRKGLLVKRLRKLAGIFAIEVCAYAVMENHYHTILRTRPDIGDGWSDEEVARRWLTLFPRNKGLKGRRKLTVEEQIRFLMNCPELIAMLRQRLSSLSWFMGQLNEYMARASNKEDGVKGRFWESRFQCQALLDEAAIASCMVYVDLNPVRAGRAVTPEESDFASIQERIRAWGKKAEESESMDRMDHWLCPIRSEGGRRGILPMTAGEYFDLVDKSGRMIRSDKGGAIEADLEPILLRIGVNPQAWTETVSSFGDRFSLVAGLLCNLRQYASHLGRRWFKGVAAAQKAFMLSPPQGA